MDKGTRVLRTTAALFVVVFLTAVSIAAVPQLVPYQGLLTDGAGDPVTDGAHLVKFIIYDAPAAGTDLWNSGFQNVSTVNGLFSYELGSNVALPDNLFTDTSRYLGITVGVDPEITPRTRLETTPYAYHALRSDSAEHAASADLLGTLTPGDVALSSHNHDGTYATTGHSHAADITAVNAGTGMTGGGTSGSVTLNADPAYLQRRVTGTATPGQAIRAINSDGSIVAENIPQGDITAVNAGSGLSGGGANGSVTLFVGSNEVTDSHIAPNAIGASELQNHLETRAGIITLNGSTTNSTYTAVDSVSFTAPASGYVLVSVVGGWFWNYDATSSNSVTDCGNINFSRTPNSSSSTSSGHNGAAQNICYQDADNASGANATGTLSLQRLDAVTSGVTYKYYLNVDSDGTHSFGTYSYTRASFLFVSSSMTITALSPPVSPNDNLQPEQIEQDTPEQN